MEEFLSRLKKILERKAGGDYSVYFRKIIKTNDTEFDSVNIIKEKSRIAKNIYLNQYYALYKSGKRIEDIAEDIMQEALKEDEVLDGGIKELLGNIDKYTEVKDRLSLKLINLKMNREYLKEKCFRIYLDFAITPCILWGEENRGMSVAVTKDLVENWGIDEDRLFKDAFENVKKLMPVKIMSIADMINECMEMKGFSDEDEASAMYVLSNGQLNYGAVCILFDGVLKVFAEEHDAEEVYILPSSVHEVILIPKNADTKNDVESFKQMVCEVNDGFVSNEEILSNNLYIYDRRNDEIRIWDDSEE